MTASGCEIPFATSWQPAERHIPSVITSIEPVNLWSHPVSCSGPLCTCFQSHILYRFFVSFHQENNSHEACWDHTKNYISPKKNWQNLVFSFKWEISKQQKNFCYNKWVGNGVSTFTSTLLHMLSASHRLMLDMKPYCKHIIPFFIRMAHEYIPASSS